MEQPLCTPHPSDVHLGPTVDFTALYDRLYHARIPQRRFALVAGVSYPVLSAALTGKIQPGFRVRYRVAIAVRHFGLNNDGKIVTGDDGFINYAER